MLYTSYLGNKRNFPADAKVFYIMPGRGNDKVAPRKEDLEAFKNKQITWHEFARRYREKLENLESWKWMERVAKLAKHQTVILCCYEKDPTHCHRSILLDRIKRLFPQTPIGGEL